MEHVQVKRLVGGDRALAREMFAMMAAVFGEHSERLDDDHLDRLLGWESFWALAALDGSQAVGGLTAHALPMTHSASFELFVYDLAVHPDYQRRGVGTGLMRQLRVAAGQAGIGQLFVLADDEDEHVLDFYRAQGAADSSATVFSLATN